MNNYYRNENYEGACRKSFYTLEKGAVRDFSDILNLENSLYAAGYQLLGNKLCRDSYGFGKIICQYNDYGRGGLTQQEHLFFECAYFSVSRLIHSEIDDRAAEVDLCFYLTKLGKAMVKLPQFKRYIDAAMEQLDEAFGKEIQRMNRHASTEA